jgi:hypothetical protein
MMILFRTPLYTLGSVFIHYIGKYIFNHILGDKFIVYIRILKIGIKGVQGCTKVDLARVQNLSVFFIDYPYLEDKKKEDVHCVHPLPLNYILINYNACWS